MKKACFVVLLACYISILSSPAGAQPIEFSFGVIGHPFKATTDETGLREVIAETDDDNLAFVVANGIKSANEACSDALYLHRKSLFDAAKNGLVVSPAASDWSECKNTHGRAAAAERLNRLRDIFFADEFSLGASKIPLIRQSSTAKFRSYGENVRWEIGDVMFATANLPANNNRYRIEAGRNSEFEDRMIANRDWLHRVFTVATRKKMRGIVLFSDGNPVARPGILERFDFSGKRDGFSEIRQQINALAAKFSGRVLVIHSQTEAGFSTPTNIEWKDNLGQLGVGTGWVKLTVSATLPGLFGIGSATVAPKNTVQ